MKTYKLTDMEIQVIHTALVKYWLSEMRDLVPKTDSTLQKRRATSSLLERFKRDLGKHQL